MDNLRRTHFKAVNIIIIGNNNLKHSFLTRVD